MTFVTLGHLKIRIVSAESFYNFRLTANSKLLAVDKLKFAVTSFHNWWHLYYLTWSGRYDALDGLSSRQQLNSWADKEFLSGTQSVDRTGTDYDSRTPLLEWEIGVFDAQEFRWTTKIDSILRKIDVIQLNLNDHRCMWIGTSSDSDSRTRPDILSRDHENSTPTGFFIQGLFQSKTPR